MGDNPAGWYVADANVFIPGRTKTADNLQTYASVPGRWFPNNLGGFRVESSSSFETPLPTFPQAITPLGTIDPEEIPDELKPIMMDEMTVSLGIQQPMDSVTDRMIGTEFDLDTSLRLSLMGINPMLYDDQGRLIRNPGAIRPGIGYFGLYKNRPLFGQRYNAGTKQWEAAYDFGPEPGSFADILNAPNLQQAKRSPVVEIPVTPSGDGIAASSGTPMDVESPIKLESVQPEEQVEGSPLSTEGDETLTEQPIEMMTMSPEAVDASNPDMLAGTDFTSPAAILDNVLLGEKSADLTAGIFATNNSFESGQGLVIVGERNGKLGFWKFNDPTSKNDALWIDGTVQSLQEFENVMEKLVKEAEEVVKTRSSSELQVEKIGNNSAQVEFQGKQYSIFTEQPNGVWQLEQRDGFYFWKPATSVKSEASDEKNYEPNADVKPSSETSGVVPTAPPLPKGKGHQSVNVKKTEPLTAENIVQAKTRLKQVSQTKKAGRRSSLEQALSERIPYKAEKEDDNSNWE